MTARGRWQLWANYLAEDLQDVQAGEIEHVRGRSRARIERLREFARQVQRGADPHARPSHAQPGSGLAPEDGTRTDIDQDQESYALAVWLSDAGGSRDQVLAWAGQVQRVAEIALSTGTVPNDLKSFASESLQPFLARVERLDEAPDEDFVSLALARSDTSVR
jgi:hypothetical protein